MDYHLRKIAESGDSIRSLYFSRPGIFSNAVILKPEITSLIQDAEYRENLLFSSDGNVRFNRVVVPDDGQHLDNECNVEVLCAAAEKLLKLYPIPGAAVTVQDYRRRYVDASEKISGFEEVVEQQRRQLASFNNSLNEELDDSSVIEKKISQTEREIETLQQELYSRQKEVRIR
jgi:hypothetical protein